MTKNITFVIPAHAGIQLGIVHVLYAHWFPAYAGMTERYAWIENAIACMIDNVSDSTPIDLQTQTGWQLEVTSRFIVFLIVF